jgi:hypothetical protein
MVKNQVKRAVKVGILAVGLFAGVATVATPSVSADGFGRYCYTVAGHWDWNSGTYWPVWRNEYTVCTP